MQDVWNEVDRYFGDLLAPSDPVLDGVLAANARAGLPSIDVSRPVGKFLHLLTRISAAKRVLEIGTLGGYSTIWFARAVGPQGRVVTLEASPDHAAVARSNLQAAGVLDTVDLRVGRAIDTLPVLEREALAPFDLVFIDADKRSNPDYLTWALRLSRPGTVIVIDNVVRDGRVVDASSEDPDIRGVRACLAMMASEPRLSATAIQTVGSKGYDGFAVALVVA
jgi:predicted O-methyltransferase YrrM